MNATDTWIENANGSFEVHRQTRTKGRPFSVYVYDDTGRASEDLTLAEAKALRDWLSDRIAEIEVQP